MYRSGEPTKSLNLEEPQDDLMYLNQMSQILSMPLNDSETTFIAEEEGSTRVDPNAFSYTNLNDQSQIKELTQKLSIFSARPEQGVQQIQSTPQTTSQGGQKSTSDDFGFEHTKYNASRTSLNIIYSQIQKSFVDLWQETHSNMAREGPSSNFVMKIAKTGWL